MLKRLIYSCVTDHYCNIYKRVTVTKTVSKINGCFLCPFERCRKDLKSMWKKVEKF